MTALDTNILIYCCDSGDPERQRIAVDVVSKAVDGVLLWQVAAEFVAASRKLNAQGFTAERAWNRLAEFMALFPLILPTPGVLWRARALHERESISFWDAMIVAACVESGVERLYSEDISCHAVSKSLEVINPFQ